MQRLIRDLHDVQRVKRKFPGNTNFHFETPPNTEDSPRRNKPITLIFEDDVFPSITPKQDWRKSGGRVWGKTEVCDKV